MSSPLFTDRESLKLLELLAKYADAYRADHSNPDLTVKELAEDLLAMDESANQIKGEELRDQIYDGLNNVTHES